MTNVAMEKGHFLSRYITEARRMISENAFIMRIKLERKGKTKRITGFQQT